MIMLVVELNGNTTASVNRLTSNAISSYSNSDRNQGSSNDRQHSKSRERSGAKGYLQKFFLGIDIVIVLGTPEVIPQIEIDLEINTVMILGINIIKLVVGMVLEIILVRGVDSPQVIDIGVMRLMLVV